MYTKSLNMPLYVL